MIKKLYYLISDFDFKGVHWKEEEKEEEEKKKFEERGKIENWKGNYRENNEKKVLIQYKLEIEKSN